MKSRIVAAVACLLIGTGWATAQPAEPVADPALAERIGLASFLPTGTPGAERVWVSADYLLTFVRGSNLPPLLTTSDPGTPRGAAGVYGAAGTSSLFGEGWVNGGLRSGFRFGTGYWFNNEQSLGIDAGFMIVEGAGTQYSTASDGTTILARPFVNAFTGAPSSQLIAFPGLSSGAVDMSVTSSNFYTAHIDLAEKAIDEGWFRLYAMIGYRYYRYDERFAARQGLSPLSPNFVAGTQVFTSDSFYTRNEFHGLDMGYRTQFNWERLSLEFLTKLAVGRVTRAIDIDGKQVVSVPGVDPLVQNGGFLASGTNSALSGTGDWKVMPEFGVMLTWQARQNLNLRIGYSFILLNGVNRVADQIDTTINPNFLPGGNPNLGGQVRPANPYLRSDMWIQSLNLGVLWTY